MNSFTLTLEHLPPSELFPNALRRIHWSKRAKAEKDAREEAYMLAHSAEERKPFKKASIAYYFYIPDNRKRDIEALIGAAKPYVDGLVDAGVIVDDDSFHLPIAVARAIKAYNAQTDIVIEEIE